MAKNLLGIFERRKLGGRQIRRSRRVSSTSRRKTASRAVFPPSRGANPPVAPCFLRLAERIRQSRRISSISRSESASRAVFSCSRIVRLIAIVGEKVAWKIRENGDKSDFSNRKPLQSIVISRNLKCRTLPCATFEVAPAAKVG